MKLQLHGKTAYAYTGGRPLDTRLPGVVFIHGALHDHSVWILQSRSLAHHGHAVFFDPYPGMLLGEASLAHETVSLLWVE
jgi:pimeloyl-ACP methyl ester carboxylesterase